MNKKGQALLEFIIILPIFLLLVLGSIDFGKIIYEQNKLQVVLNDVSDMIDNNYTNDEIQKNINKDSSNIINFKKEYIDNSIKITLETNIKITTPGLSNILKNPYTITVSRIMYE